MESQLQNITKEQLALYFDHTVLKATAVSDEIALLCDQALEYRFASVCVNPRWVRFCTNRLEGSGVRTCTVTGFPLGADGALSKAEQTRIAINEGADEIDIVADLAAILEGDMKTYLMDMDKVLKVCQSVRPGVCLKVILEMAALSPEQKIFACKGASQVGVDFVKTSTGFHPAGGANVEDVRLMREHAGGCKIKAAGGIGTVETAFAMIEAGANRIGASKSVEIMQEFLELKSQGRL